MPMKNKQLNVIIINDFANINGGTAKIAIDTAIGLSQIEGVSVHYFCAVGENDETLSKASITSITHLNQEENINSKNKIKGLIRGVWNNEASRRIKVLLRQFDKSNTIVHVHGWTKCLSVSPIATALKLGFNTVITLHDFFIYCPNGGFYNFPKNQICHKVPLSLDCIMTNCDSRNYLFKLYRVVRSSVQRLVFSVYKKKTDLIVLSDLSEKVMNSYIKNFKTRTKVENPIDVIKNPMSKPELNKTCVFIGRLSAEKGVEYLCEALNLIDYTDAIIIGEGNEKLGLQDRYPNVKFVGWQNKQQIRLILQKARFLAFPSVWYETYGLVVQEACSYGIPCIVSDCTAAVELIDDGLDGLIFNSKNVDHLAGLMKDLLEDDHKVSFLGKNAYAKFWGKDHSIENYSRQVKDVYEMILDSNTEVNNT